MKVNNKNKFFILIEVLIILMNRYRTACTAMVETKQHWLEGQTLKVIPRKFTNNSRKIHPSKLESTFKC